MFVELLRTRLSSIVQSGATDRNSCTVVTQKNVFNPCFLFLSIPDRI